MTKAYVRLILFRAIGGIACCLPLLVGLLISSCSALAQDDSEAQVKASFIYNFAKFVEWPPDSFAGAHQAISVCLAGSGPFGFNIERAVKGKTINAHQLVVRRISTADESKDCQILYLGAIEKKRIRQLLAQVGNSPVLTVGESDTFANSVIVIGFLMDEGKVRFDINLEAARRARLKISSKLLSLARTVKGPGQ